MEMCLIVLNPFKKRERERKKVEGFESKRPRAQVERLLSVSHCEASQPSTLSEGQNSAHK